MYQQVPVVGKECGDQGNERAAEGACISTTTKWSTEKRTHKGAKNEWTSCFNCLEFISFGEAICLTCIIIFITSIGPILRDCTIILDALICNRHECESTSLKYSMNNFNWTCLLN